jgi:periplasmic protein TonB
VSIADAFFQSFPAPRWWRSLDFSRRVLAMALVISSVAHAGVLAMRFSLPEASRMKPVDARMDVILVNARHAEKPVKAEALAQANLDGGGDAATGRAKSFLTKSRKNQDGDELREASARVHQLEEEQKKLMTTLRTSNARIAASDARAEAQPDPAQPVPQVSGADLYASSSAILRREAEINKRIEDENARPKRGQITPSTREVEFASYFRQWTDKVERHGNNNYPEAAKGRMYVLVMTASLFADGGLEKVEIDRSSGNREIDAAALRIVRSAGPYGRFSPAMKSKYGVIDFTLTWTFAREDALSVQGRN